MKKILLLIAIIALLSFTLDIYKAETQNPFIEEGISKSEFVEDDTKKDNDLEKDSIGNTEQLQDLKTLPTNKILEGGIQVFQSFNNCGPAALSMALSYYDINKSQGELGEILRPYQIPNGDNDDKSVTLQELAAEAQKYGFITYHRPMGNSEIIENLINYDIPVITRTILKEGDDIGHYRVIKGFNREKGIFIQDDSLQGKNLEYTYEQFNSLWKKFNYEFLILVPAEKENEVNKILGEIETYETAWQKAEQNSIRELQDNPNDIYARFNLVVALYNQGKYEDAINEYEKVENKMPKRTLWYQIEPILAYYKTDNYEKVLSISQYILENGNRAYSELYLLRGNIYLSRGEKNMARTEYEKALKYNKNYEDAKIAITKL